MNGLDTPSSLRTRHLRIGWWALFVFALLGVILEALHGFKVAAYLDASNEPRRLLWRLAHAHGIGLSLVHVAFAFTAGAMQHPPRWASACLTGALLAMPAGFFLGGLWPVSGDPGAGIVLVPLGALLLLVAIGAVARATRAAGYGD